VTGAEAAGIHVHQAVSVVEIEQHAGMRWRRDGVEQQRPGHAQMHEQVALARQRPDQVLAGTADALDQRAA
jgi:hypothetical protein